MIPFLDLVVTELSQVGEARRQAVRLAASHEMGETERGRIALVATELGTNLVRHATRGRLLIGYRRTPDGGCLELVSIDSGPGMDDASRCLRDGFSSGGTPGTGLGAVQRLSSDFSMFSLAGRGTVILSRIQDAVPGGAPTSRRFACAGITLAAPREEVSGDAWDVRVDGGRAALIVADGLGHGPIAAEAAGEAIRTFGLVRAAPSLLLERAHAAMRATRGAAVAIAEADADAGTITFSGAGNIAGRLLSGVEDRTLMSQHGTVGVQVRKLQDIVYPWPDHALLILHSDGLATRWNFDGVGGLLQCDPAVVAGWLVREQTRGHDDVTVVVLKRG